MALGKTTELLLDEAVINHRSEIVAVLELEGVSSGVPMLASRIYERVWPHPHPAHGHRPLTTPDTTTPCHKLIPADVKISE